MGNTASAGSPPVQTAWAALEIERQPGSASGRAVHRAENRTFQSREAVSCDATRPEAGMHVTGGVAILFPGGLHTRQCFMLAQFTKNTNQPYRVPRNRTRLDSTRQQPRASSAREFCFLENCCRCPAQLTLVALIGGDGCRAQCPSGFRGVHCAEARSGSTLAGALTRAASEASSASHPVDALCHEEFLYPRAREPSEMLTTYHGASDDEQCNGVPREIYSFDSSPAARLAVGFGRTLSICSLLGRRMSPRAIC